MAFCSVAKKAGRLACALADLVAASLNRPIVGARLMGRASNSHKMRTRARLGGRMARYMIREDGKNGTVEILDDRLVRERKKRMGKTDVQTIPLRSVTGVHHDRKTLGTDLVRLDVGGVSYEWKVKDAERMVAELHGKIYTDG